MTEKSNYVLVSGGSGGIGSALCRMLPTIGYRPIIAYRNHRERAEALATECLGQTLELDLTNDESIEQALTHLTDLIGTEGKLSGVVLAASPPPELLAFGKLTSSNLTHQFRVNVVGPQLLLAGLIKKFFRKEKSGFVIGILTEAIGNDSRPPATSMGAYIIAKTAMKGMLSVCAAEHQWLQVHTSSPGFTETEMLKVFDPRHLELMRMNTTFSTAEEAASRILEKIPR